MHIKTHVILGVALIVIAILAFAYQGISYTTGENLAGLGPLHMTADQTKTLPLPPVVGGAALTCGIVLLTMGSKKG
jgi:hypothetical protein